MDWILYGYLTGFLLIAARCAWLNHSSVRNWEDFATCVGLIVLWPISLCLETSAIIRSFRQRGPTRDEVVSRIHQNRRLEEIDDGWSDDLYVAMRAAEDDCSTLDES